MIIAGAGLAGLIAGTYFRGHKHSIIEKQNQLPHNHHAVLRFKTDIISQITGIPFRRVFVRKSVVHGVHYLEAPNPYAANSYSLKVANGVYDRSIWDVEHGHRYLAPEDFHKILAEDHVINYGINLVTDMMGKEEPVISTIPMPILMDIVGWKDKPQFKFNTIWTLRCFIEDPHCQAQQTIYFSDIEQPWYRATISGNLFMMEFAQDPLALDSGKYHIAKEGLDFFGLKDATISSPTIHEQRFGKIIPIDEDLRKEFMYTMTREYNVYSLGRFATWRPVLLDDLANDLKVIEGLISADGARRRYAQNLAIAQARIR